MYRKTFVVGFAGLASASSWGASGMPSCWSSCFASNGVTSEAACCQNDALSKCIEDSCSSAESGEYWTWYDGSCPSVSSTGSTISATTPTGYSSATSLVSTPTTLSVTTPTTSPVETSPVQSVTTPAGYSPTTLTSTTSSPVTTPTSSPSWTATSPISPTTTSRSSTATAPTSTPTCWTECFQENGITAESQLCGSTSVDQCIQDKCNSAQNGQYRGWYSTYCQKSSTTGPTNSPASPTTPSTTLQTTTSPSSPATTSPATGITTTPAGASPTADCWSACFAKYDVVSEMSLCGNDDVSKCIHDTCSTSLNQAYWEWANAFCSQSTTSSVITTTYTTTPVGGTTALVSTTTYVSTITIPCSPKVTPSTTGLPTPYETSPAQQTPTASYPGGPIGGAPSGTLVTSGYGVSTPSSPAGAQGTPVVPGASSYYPAGAASVAPSGGYPSGTGAWVNAPSASGYAPVAATGDSSSTKPGVLFAVAMAFIALF